MRSSISIIGTGNMASALAGRALAGGNAVEIIGRDPTKAEELAAALGGATVGTTGAAPAGDITNPITPDLSGFLTPQGTFGAQEIAKDAPAGAHVVKAFNTVPSDVLAAGSAEGRPLDVFIAGDDAEAKVSVSAFVESLGMRPLDTGPLSMARALEHATLRHLGLVAHSVKHTKFFLGVNILS
jgi:predicted dinucleotide-binding enzyme